MKRFKYFCMIGMVMFFATPAWSQDPGVILSKIDSVQNAFSDMTATEQMNLMDDKGQIKQRIVEIRQKGDELRMVRFREPADVRGVGFLRLARDRLYLYLPAFRRVRRIASSATDENFMGTDFTYEDMSQNSYSDDYLASKISKNGDMYKLVLQPRDGAGIHYSKLVIYADQGDFVLRKVEYYDGRGEQIKTLTVDDIQQIDGYWMGRKMTMQNQARHHTTRLSLSDIRFDQGLSDGEFTERSLKRPIR